MATTRLDSWQEAARSTEAELDVRLVLSRAKSLTMSFRADVHTVKDAEALA